MDLNLTAVGFYQAFGNGKTQPAAAGDPGAGLVHPVETLKDIGQVLGRDSFAGIGYGYLYPTTLLSGTNHDAVSFISVSYRILQQVTQDLANPVRVNIDLWQPI
jgi:hypothetical protein